jgi:hypothetical protein
LEVLDVRDTMLTYPDFLAACPKLVELKLTDNPIADLTGLAGLSQLERIEVTLQPAISGSVSLTPLTSLMRLESILLDGGAISDLQVLEQLKSHGRLTDVRFQQATEEDE